MFVWLKNRITRHCFGSRGPRGSRGFGGNPKTKNGYLNACLHLLPPPFPAGHANKDKQRAQPKHATSIWSEFGDFRKKRTPNATPNADGVAFGVRFGFGQPPDRHYYKTLGNLYGPILAFVSPRHHTPNANPGFRCIPGPECKPRVSCFWRFQFSGWGGGRSVRTDMT